MTRYQEKKKLFIVVLVVIFIDMPTTELYHATLGCLQLGTYQQLNLSCANDSLIYVTDVRHGHSNQSQVACKPEMTSSPVDDSWCLDGPPYNEMVLIQCNSRASCTVDTAEMSSVMYTCQEQITDTIRATYRCLPGMTVKLTRDVVLEELTRLETCIAAIQMSFTPRPCLYLELRARKP